MGWSTRRRYRDSLLLTELTWTLIYQALVPAVYTYECMTATNHDHDGHSNQNVKNKPNV